MHVLVFASSDAAQAMSLADSVSATMPDRLLAGGAGEEDDAADILKKGCGRIAARSKRS